MHTCNLNVCALLCVCMLHMYACACRPMYVYGMYVCIRYVCMYTVCMYVYGMYVCMYVRTYVRLCVCACVHVSIHECMNLSVYVRCTYVYIHPYVGLAYEHI